MNYEKHPTIENLLKSLEQDSIERNEYLLRILRILTNYGGNKFFSLDGDWGSGKTYFVKQLDLLINYCNSIDKDNTFAFDSPCLVELQKISNHKQSIEGVLGLNNLTDFKKIVEDENIYSVYFNAWEHDDEDDPLLSIIFQIINNYSKIFDGKDISIETGKAFGKAIKGLLGKVVDVESFIGEDGIVKVNDLTEKIKEKKQLKESISKIFESIINENCNKLIIIIDELDRCKPTYAVKLLERMRHYIIDERITILVSTNVKELQHTISGLYGADFDSVNYLSKFFDVNLCLPNIEVDKYIMNKILSENEIFDHFVVSFAKYKNLNMREIDRFLTNIQYFEPSIYMTDTWGGELLRAVKKIMIPYAVGLFSTQQASYWEFIEGNGFKKFEQFLKTVDWSQKMLDRLTGNRSTNTVNVKEDIILDLEKAYNILVVKKGNASNATDREFLNESGLDNSSFFNMVTLLGDLAVLEKK